MKNGNSLDAISLILQLINLEILFRDCNNKDLMQELKQQDDVLEKKICNNLEKIIEQNEKIIKYLEERR